MNIPVLTLEDILPESTEFDTLEDAFFQMFRGTEIRPDMWERERSLELVMPGEDTIDVDMIQGLTQKCSDLISQHGAGQLQFLGVRGGSDWQVILVYKY